MSKTKRVIVRDVRELARALRLTPCDATEMTVRSGINDKMVQAVKKSGLTHEEVARAARTSRTRLTAILNRNTARVSTDLMLRILAALGYRAKITFVRTRHAA